MTPMGPVLLLVGLLGLLLLAREHHLAHIHARWQDERLRADRLALIEDYSLREGREVAALDDLMVFSVVQHNRCLGDWPFEEDL